MVMIKRDRFKNLVFLTESLMFFLTPHSLPNLHLFDPLVILLFVLVFWFKGRHFAWMWKIIWPRFLILSGALIFNGERWNSVIRWGLTGAKAFAKDVFINQERKLGDRRRLDTVVVLFYRKRSRLRIGSQRFFLHFLPFPCFFLG